jgi:hypothetical protein
MMDSNSPVSPPRRKPVSWKKGAIIIAVLVIGQYLAYDAILFPWFAPADCPFGW